MRTGCWPSRHGVVNNTAMIPGCLDPKWLWYHDVLRCGDLFDACKAAGLTTASVGWPSTGKHPSIDYLVDEVAGLKVKTYEAFHGYYTVSGTPEALYQAVIAPNIHLRAERDFEFKGIAFGAWAECMLNCYGIDKTNFTTELSRKFDQRFNWSIGGCLYFSSEW
jgi:hypothetical protein